MAKITFKVGARVIDAPLPNATLEDNVKTLARSYPEFRWTCILDSDANVLSDGSLEYELVLPPAKVNG